MLRDFKIHIVAIGIFLASFITGLTVFQDYGISWDEPAQHMTGQITYDYVFAGDPTYKTYINRDYGVAFQLPLIILEKVLGLKDPRDIYNMRKLVTHCLFLFSAFVFYLLIYTLYKNRSLALAGYLILLVTPRIYAQSFFNSKDIPFMSMFILCFFLYTLAFRRRKLFHFILFGVGTGLLMSIRVMGVLMPAIVSAMILIDFILEKEKKKTVINYLFYLAALLAVLISSWPFLWENPATNFLAAFSHMAKFRWDQAGLFMGEMVRSGNVGWNYVPVWFGVTTPLPYLILGLAGIGFVIRNFFRQPALFIRNTPERNQLAWLFFFFGPILSVIVLHSVLYDGWRQLYFIYPPFILLAVYGVSCLIKGRTASVNLLSPAIGLILFMFMLSLSTIMVRNHPFEDIYFNDLVSKDDQHLRKSFELDYWGTSYKQALEYIAGNDKSDSVRISVAHFPGQANSYMLPKNERNRIRYVDDVKDATWFISTYRWHPQDYDFPSDQKIFSIKVMNSDICSVWKIQ
jgi:hypothetical protein